MGWTGVYDLHPVSFLLTVGVAAACCPSIRNPISTLRDVQGLRFNIRRCALKTWRSQLYLAFLMMPRAGQACAHLYISSLSLRHLLYGFPSHNFKPGDIGGPRVSVWESGVGRCFMPGKYLMLCSWPLVQILRVLLATRPRTDVRCTQTDEENLQWTLALESSSAGFEGCRHTQTPPPRPLHL